MSTVYPSYPSGSASFPRSVKMRPPIRAVASNTHTRCGRTPTFPPAVASRHAAYRPPMPAPTTATSHAPPGTLSPASVRADATLGMVANAAVTKATTVSATNEDRRWYPMGGDRGSNAHGRGRRGERELGVGEGSGGRVQRGDDDDGELCLACAGDGLRRWAADRVAWRRFPLFNRPAHVADLPCRSKRTGQHPSPAHVSCCAVLARLWYRPGGWVAPQEAHLRCKMTLAAIPPRLARCIRRAGAAVWRPSPPHYTFIATVSPRCARAAWPGR